MLGNSRAKFFNSFTPARLGATKIQLRLTYNFCRPAIANASDAPSLPYIKALNNPISEAITYSNWLSHFSPELNYFFNHPINVRLGVSG